MLSISDVHAKRAEAMYFSSLRLFNVMSRILFLKLTISD